MTTLVPAVAAASWYLLQTMTQDIVAVWQHVFGSSTERVPTLLVGHSMGGALAVWAAATKTITGLDGVVVIDVVEGTAMGEGRAWSNLGMICCPLNGCRTQLAIESTYCCSNALVTAASNITTHLLICFLQADLDILEVYLKVAGRQQCRVVGWAAPSNSNCTCPACVLPAAAASCIAAHDSCPAGPAG